MGCIPWMMELSPLEALQKAAVPEQVVHPGVIKSDRVRSYCDSTNDARRSRSHYWMVLHGTVGSVN